MSDSAERKKAYDRLYSAIGGEIRLWANPRSQWESVSTGEISPKAKELLKALLEELSNPSGKSN